MRYLEAGREWAGRGDGVLDARVGRRSQMAKAGAFHRKHGSNIRLLEEDTVAHRVDSYNKAVVFTAQAIPPGAMFQVKLLDKGGGWAGSIVSLHSTRGVLRAGVIWVGYRGTTCINCPLTTLRV